MPTESNTAFVGVFVSEELDTQLRLIALLQGVTKSTLVRNILHGKMEDNDWTQDSLIERYATVLWTEWDLKYREMESLSSYLSVISNDLKAKKSVPLHIQAKIMAKCKELNKKQSQTK